MARAPLQQTDPAWVGRYRLVARLGAGGMGVVYLAETWDGQPVAVKVLRPELADNPEFRTRFGREVAALTRVQGVCTVRVIEADTEAPKPFLVTEYADGPSLSEYVDAHGPLDPGMLYGLATGLAEALAAIHAAGIVHRDLKPSNVLLTAGGPKVIDFGIAQALDTTSMTRTGITVGSAGFMAPEQIMGRAGTAADVFTWAVTVTFAAGGPGAVRDRGARRHHVPDRARSPRHQRGAAGPAPAGRGGPGQGPAGPAHRGAAAGPADQRSAGQTRLASTARGTRTRPRPCWPRPGTRPRPARWGQRPDPPVPAPGQGRGPPAAAPPCSRSC